MNKEETQAAMLIFTALKEKGITHRIVDTHKLKNGAVELVSGRSREFFCHNEDSPSPGNLDSLILSHCDLNN